MKKILSAFMCFCMIFAFSFSAVAIDQITTQANMRSVPVLSKNMKTGEITESVFTYESKASTARGLADLVQQGWFPETVNKQGAENALVSGMPTGRSSGTGILGSDDRVQVSDTDEYPYSAVCYIEVAFSTGAECGTAFMIGDNIAVTAAHCVYKNGELVSDVKVWPGKDGFSIFGNPFGTAESISIFKAPNYNQGDFYKYDWAIIVLDENIGNDTGWFGFTCYQPDYLTTTLTLSGYPHSDQYHQYTATGNAMKYVDKVSEQEYRFQHNMDSTEGQSGSPIYNSSYMVYGIDSYHSTLNNYATRIDESTFNYFTAYVRNY